MPKFETVDAIRMAFQLLEPKADTKEEMEIFVDSLLKIKEAVNKVIADILPGIDVRWEVPAPGTAIIEDREKPAATTTPRALEVPKTNGGTTPGYI